MARILFAEDNDEIRLVVADALTDSGYIVVTAKDGNEALNHWRGGPFDLLVTDLRMPVRDGLWLIREVLSEHPTTPIVLLTATPPTTDEFRADLHRVLLSKPVDLDQLLLTVSQLCG